MHPKVELIQRDERGRIVDRRLGRNIWVSSGRQWLRDVIRFSSYGPNVVADDRRLRYVGFGIGGSKQSSALASSAPMSTDYAGTNVQTDVNPGVTQLERPVRLAAGVYLRQWDVPTFPVPNCVLLRTTLASADITYGGYSVVPLSEIGLYLSDATVSSGTNTLVAYDTFEPIFKRTGHSIEVVWAITN